MTDEPPHEQGDESPPTSQPGRTPAERAGATPLDPERFKANAGMPELVGRDVVYSLGPDGYAAHVAGLLAAGARFVGGCCGTTPDHIAAIGEVLVR